MRRVTYLLSLGDIIMVRSIRNFSSSTLLNYCETVLNSTTFVSHLKNRSIFGGPNLARGGGNLSEAIFKSSNAQGGLPARDVSFECTVDEMIGSVA